MHRLRPAAALALLVVSVAIAAACQGKQQNGQECLKSDDCEGDSQCISYVCTDLNASKPPFDSGTVTVDSGAEAATEAATDAAEETAAETGTDSAADSGTTDSGTSDSSDAD